MSPRDSGRPGWLAPSLVLLGLATAGMSVATLYFSGICGFQADAARSAACMWRWRGAGGLLGVTGITLLAWGVWLARKR